jgi:hypothetical protein
MGVERPTAGSRRQVSDSYTPRQSLPQRVFGSLFGNPVVLITVLILILVALLVAWAMLANSCKKQGEEKIIPANGGVVVNEDTGTGVTDADGETPATEGEGEEDPRYGPFELAVEPAAGSGPWVRVTVDGENVYEGTLAEKNTWQVTADCVVLTAQPDNVKVTRNGEESSFAGNDEGTYSVVLEVEAKPSDQTDQTDQEGQTDQTG